MSALGKLSSCATLALALGCLPKDTRPPPSRVLLTASPSPTTAGTATTETADGWHVSFERVLVSIGRVSLDGRDCSVYSEADYGRVLSLLGAPAAQKISESYALGTCDFGFGVANAGSESPLGVGTAPADLDFMRTPGTDDYNELRGVSAFVSGRAKQAARELTFAWSFRGRVRYSECQVTVDGQLQPGLSLAQDGDVAVDVTISAEQLFSENPALLDAALRFDPIASADELGNADGEVGLDELKLVPLSELQAGDAYSAGAGAVWTNLGDFVYLAAAPQIVRYAGDGECKVRLGDMMRGD